MAGDARVPGAAGADCALFAFGKRYAPLSSDVSRGNRAATMFVRHAPRGYLKAQYCGVMCSEMLRFPSSPSSVAVIPMLFMGSLIMESFFGIPGLGSYTIDALGGTGLFRRTHDGFSRHLRLHHRLDCYRYCLCLGGSAHPTRLMRSRLSQDSSEHRSIRHASCFPSD